MFMREKRSNKILEEVCWFDARMSETRVRPLAGR